MLDNATATIGLKELDELRDSYKYFVEIRRDISNCYKAKVIELSVSDVCENCNDDIDCPDCEHHQSLYEEHLVVNVDKLINITKKYALLGKEMEFEDINTAIITKK